MGGAGCIGTPGGAIPRWRLLLSFPREILQPATASGCACQFSGLHGRAR
jgi:hypothetical protein